MFQDYYGDRSPEQVAKVFGARLRQALFQLKPGAWQGPIESGFGWHLVWVDSIDARPGARVRGGGAGGQTAWVAEQRAESERQAFEAMRARYEVVLPVAGRSGGSGYAHAERSPMSA